MKLTTGLQYEIRFGAYIKVRSTQSISMSILFKVTFNRASKNLVLDFHDSHHINVMLCKHFLDVNLG